MNTGILQRRWSEERPEIFNKVNRIVCLDIRQEKQKNEKGVPVDGFSFIPVQIDRQMDYGHIKSQLIEAAFAQKDEFALIINAVDNILAAVSSAKTFDDFKAALDTEEIHSFAEFNQFRKHCADMAKEVMKQF